MEFRTFFPQDLAGNYQPNAAATVRVAGQAALATIYDEAGSEIANPVSADTTGRIAFAAANGFYDITFSVQGGILDSRAVESVQFYDAAEVVAAVQAASDAVQTAQVGVERARGIVATDYILQQVGGDAQLALIQSGDVASQDVAFVTAAAQAALDAAEAAGGGRVFLPNGRYLVSGLRIPPGVIFEGEAATRDPFSGKPGARLHMADAIQYYGSADTDETYEAVIWTKNSAVNGRGGQIRNIVIDMEDAPAACDGIQIAGAWHHTLEHIYINDVRRRGVYCHTEDEGSYWLDFRQVLVTGDRTAAPRVGTGFALTGDNPNSGTSANGRTNQVTMTQCKADYFEYGFDFDTCGAGIVAINCQAEHIDIACVRERDNTTEGYPLFIGGEMNGNGTALTPTGFDGRIRAIACSVNSLNGGVDFANGAVALDLNRIDAPYVFRMGGDAPTVQGMGGGSGQGLLTVDAAHEVLDIPASTATSVIRIPTGGNEHGVLAVRAFVQNSSGAHRFRNTMQTMTLMFRDEGVSLDIDRTFSQTAINGLTWAAAVEAGHIELRVTHTESAGAAEVNATVHLSGLCTAGPVA